MSKKAIVGAAVLALPARLILAGQVSYILVTQFHVGGNANDHHSIFAAYAENQTWMAVHLGQFVSMAVLLSGLIVLAFALDYQSEAARWMGRVGAAGAVATLALYGVLQAVDGVALKHAANAWTSASEGERVSRFATAEAIRWLEWGMRSYQDYAMGLSLLLFAGSTAQSMIVARPVPQLICLSGLAYLSQGWLAGSEGFSTNQSIAIVLGWILSLTWMGWLAVIASRRSGRSHKTLEASSRNAA